MSQLLQAQRHGSASSTLRVLLRSGHLPCRGLSMDKPVEGHLATLSAQCSCGRAAGDVSARARSTIKRPRASLLRRIALRDFVAEASHRFAIPSSWIRAVMRVESLGDPLALSPKGAMGLMQIMPDTWSELRSRYGLGADPYDPHDNIMAGAAYLRELHDRYGERGFLAAYNAGPSRYEDHLATGRPLPSETLLYMAAVASLVGARVDEGGGGDGGPGGLMDCCASICDTSGSRLLAIATNIQCADAKRSRWRNGANRDSAYAALRWAIRQAIRSESTAMTSIGLHRLLAGCRRRLSVGGRGARTSTTGRQGKSAACGRAHMVVRLEFCAPSGLRAGWRFSWRSQRFQRRDRRRRLIEPICAR